MFDKQQALKGAFFVSVFFLFVSAMFPYMWVTWTLIMVCAALWYYLPDKFGEPK